MNQKSLKIIKLIFRKLRDKFCSKPAKQQIHFLGAAMTSAKNQALALVLKVF